MKKFWLGFVVGIGTTILTGTFLLVGGAVLVGTYAQKTMAKGLSAPELHRLGGEPDFQYSTLTGESKRLADLRGKVVFVNVWATWCGPCKAELPSIQKLYEHYRGDPEVEMLVVADAEVEKIRSTADASHVQLPLYTVKEGDLPASMSVSAYPTTFIIARNGTVAAMHDGAADWSASAVQEFIDGLKKEGPPVAAPQ